MSSKNIEAAYPLCPMQRRTAQTYINEPQLRT